MPRRILHLPCTCDLQSSCLIVVSGNSSRGEKTTKSFGFPQPELARFTGRAPIFISAHAWWLRLERNRGGRRRRGSQILTDGVLPSRLVASSRDPSRHLFWGIVGAHAIDVK